MTNEGMPRSSGIKTHLWVQDIREDDIVNDRYLVKTKRTGQTKNGGAFLSLILSDRTGDIETRVWERADELGTLFREGDIIEVSGKAGLYRNQVQLTLSDISLSKEDDPAIFLETTPCDITAMMRDLKGIIRNIKNAGLRDLVNSFISDHRFIEKFKESPAAKNFHHGYLGGLLEHTLSVCRLAVLVNEQYPELDGDLLITGAFLHDIGKINEFSYGRTIDYSDEGRLLGHLVLGVSMLEEKLKGLKNFPQETALYLKHMILSHHGEYDFGSPKRPKFLEAFVLHLIDDLDAKMNGIARFITKDKNEGAWTDFNRMFERYLLKERLKPLEDEQVTAPVRDDRQKALF
ncbi:MAG: HD domain-containing protein [Deltaproteobacteria bacterium]|nr:HD domain-containing protein [Deltaproteobacteria bacterium]